jgi:antitoxin (DNA-binding transcriptional repressor) of toxin-antitoxin stability system
MPQIPLEDAKARLPEVIAGLIPGEQLVIVQDGEPAAVLTRTERQSWPCKAGSAEEKTYWLAADFDAPLDDFRQYM